jgi:hypothetical protein
VTCAAMSSITAALWGKGKMNEGEILCGTQLDLHALSIECNRVGG